MVKGSQKTVRGNKSSSDPVFQLPGVNCNLNRCTGSCNTLSDTSRKMCAPNKTEDVNLSIFNMITEKH